MVPVPITVYGSDARVVFHLPKGIKSAESWYQYDVDVITPIGLLYVGNSLVFIENLPWRENPQYFAVHRLIMSSTQLN